MTLIHGRPIDVAARQVVGHWESDLIKGAGNRSAVGTLVERKSRYLLLAKMLRSPLWKPSLNAAVTSHRMSARA
jgi:IS30 family transposase